jgi:glycosyltransferase involved in cell wall biosynthesis
VRILQVHNMYRSSQVSGENVVVKLLSASLAARGHDVYQFEPSSDELTGLSSVRAIAAPFGVGAWSRELHQVLGSWRPDVALVHNVYPMLGPHCVSDIAEQGIPVAHVVHNYRHSCISGNHWRAGVRCELCRPASRKSGIIHGCYRGSRAQSAILTSAETYGARSWRRLSLVINISRWMQHEVMSESPLKGIESVVINNPVAPPASTSTGLRDFLFAGRLTDEKGIRLLLEAWGMAQTDWTLHIAGEGPLAGEVIEAARTLPRIEYHGAVSPDKVAQLRGRTAVACVPALWDEPFGLVIAEAYASGQAVLATRHGAFPEIVHEGLGELLDDDPASWAKALSTRSYEKNDPLAAIAHWDRNFSPGHIAEAYETTLHNLL